MKNSGNFSEKSYQIQQKLRPVCFNFSKEIFKRENLEMTVKLGMTHAQLINAINSDIGLIKDQGSKIITKEFPASETETSSIQLDTKCQGKDYMFVFMDYGILEPSNYSLSADGLTVNFSPAVPANHKLLVRYFSYVNLATLPNGLFLGQIIQVPFGIDESKNIGRYLNGQVIIQERFPAFTAEVKSWVSTRPSLFTTETEWQSIKSSSKLGQCGKFVIDDAAGTIRLPCVVNMQSSMDLAQFGVIKSESLPQHTHNLSLSQAAGSTWGAEGAFWGGDDASRGPYDATTTNASSPTYQDNAPVQQEAVQYPYAIVVNASVEEAERPINNYQVNNVYSYGMNRYYKGDMTNNSWLKSAGQWNSENVYTGMYQWLVEQMNAGVSGFVASTATYTDYDFVINTADQTFRLPLLNGDESWVGNETSVLSTADIVKDSPFQWTVTNNGFVKFTCYKGNTTQVVIADINGQTLIHSGVATTTTTPRPGFWLKVRKGDTISISAESQTLSGVSITFIPAVGNGNLYYYIGDTLQNAQLINVARIEEKLTDVNAASRGYVVDSYHNGTDWYRIYSDGWIEQGGSIAFSSSTYKATFNFIKPFSTIPTVFTGIISNPTGDAYTGNKEPTTSSVTVFAGGWLDDGRIAAAPAYGSKVSVYACGY